MFFNDTNQQQQQYDDDAITASISNFVRQLDSMINQAQQQQ
jgi:hypothetical protein